MLESNARIGAFNEYRRQARQYVRDGRMDAAWACLEAAHILGQSETVQHVQTHWDMLMLARRQLDRSEFGGQMLRTAAAALATWLWVPEGNAGRANVSPLQRMQLPDDLGRLLYRDATLTFRDTTE
jgi:hypothetical protein